MVQIPMVVEEFFMQPEQKPWMIRCRRREEQFSNFINMTSCGINKITLKFIVYSSSLRHPRKDQPTQRKNLSGGNCEWLENCHHSEQPGSGLKCKKKLKQSSVVILMGLIFISFPPICYTFPQYKSAATSEQVQTECILMHSKCIHYNQQIYIQNSQEVFQKGHCCAYISNIASLYNSIPYINAISFYNIKQRNRKLLPTFNNIAIL